MTETERLNIAKAVSLFSAGVCRCSENKPSVQANDLIALYKILKCVTLTMYIHDTEYIITAVCICVEVWEILLDVAWAETANIKNKNVSFLFQPCLGSLPANKQFILLAKCAFLRH